MAASRMMPPSMNALRLALLGAMAVLAGCGDTPMAQALLGAAVPRVQPPAGTPVLRVGGGRRPFVFTLLQDSGGRQLWRAEGGAALAMQGARIIATAGLGTSIAATRFEGPDPLDDPRALLGQVAQARRSIDIHGANQDPAAMRFGVQLACTLRAAPDAAWLLVVEQCDGDDLGFTNRFWVEPLSGAIPRSEQWVGDAVLTLEGP